MKIKSRSIILFILFVGFIVNTISNVKAEDIKPEIYGVRINIYNHLLGSGYGTCSVESPCGFELRIWVSGNFTSLDQGDVDFKTAGVSQSVDTAEYDDSRILATGKFDSIFPPMGEYTVAVIDADGNKSDPFPIVNLTDYPKDAPELISPSHNSVIVSTRPTIEWEAFQSDYDANLVDPWSYEINLEFPNINKRFTAFPIQPTETSISYDDPRWSADDTGLPEVLPDLELGNMYHITIHSNHSVAYNVNFEHHRSDIFFRIVDKIVNIDIKPGSYPNCFNNNGKGVIPVAILSNGDFDATQVDPSQVNLNGQKVKVVGKSDKFLASTEDVNTDGSEDIVLQIDDIDNAYQTGSTTATLIGKTNTGLNFGGTDSICIVP